MREKLTDYERDAHHDGGIEDAVAEHFVHSVKQLGTIVVAGYWLHALADAHHHHDEEERDAVYNAVGGYRDVATMILQSFVDQDDNQTGTHLNAEWGEADFQDILHDAAFQSIDAFVKMDEVFRIAHHDPHINQCEHLRQDCGDGGSTDAHVEREDEQGVEDGVHDHRGDGGSHGHMWMSGGAQRGVQTKIEMGDHIAQQDDVHVFMGIANGAGTGTEKVEQRVDEENAEHSQQHAYNDVERHHVA